MKKNHRIYELVLISLLIAIEIIFMLTPLGYIPIGAIRATTLHIPVILAGILLGYKGGIILGLVFGASSLIMNTLAPTAFSFIFSPFYSIGEVSGNFYSILIAFVPRIMIGVSATCIFNFLKKTKLKQLSLPLSAFIASLVNTCLVLLGIFIFFKDTYASVKGVATTAMAGILVGQLSVNGVLEALVALVIVSVVGNILLKIAKK